MTTIQRIHIDEELCSGCGQCASACPGGALQMVDGKARLVRPDFCDGMGVCLGECPQGAITFEDVDVEMIATVPDAAAPAEAAGACPSGGCPSATMFGGTNGTDGTDSIDRTNGSHRPAAPAMSFPAPTEPASPIDQWPVQLRLLSPLAPFLAGRRLALVADCVAVADRDWRARFGLEGALAIACPKFDDPRPSIDKLAGLLAHGGVTGLDVVIMSVPCCRGLAMLAERAIAAAGREFEMQVHVVATPMPKPV